LPTEVRGAEGRRIAHFFGQEHFVRHAEIGSVTEEVGVNLREIASGEAMASRAGAR
jgi:hypothetical protein